MLNKLSLVLRQTEMRARMRAIGSHKPSRRFAPRVSSSAKTSSAPPVSDISAEPGCKICTSSHLISSAGLRTRLAELGRFAEGERSDFDRRIFALYRLSRFHFDELLILQTGLCVLCNKAVRELCIDHDHNTGLVRGLLCASCNQTIKYWEERIPQPSPASRLRAFVLSGKGDTREYLSLSDD